MARMHANCYARIKSATLVGVLDTRLEAAQDLAGAHGAQPYTEFETMLDEVRPDIVDVCCPTPFHVDYVCRAAERAAELGILGIITEKPMARTVADCERMIETCERYGVPLYVGHVLRFFPEFALTRRKIVEGAVGQPAAIRTRRGGPMPRGWNDWYGDFAMSGGCILDLIIHDFDWLRWTLGEVERVYARGTGSGRLPAFDYALVTLRFRSGAICHVEGTWADPGGFKVTFEVAGDEGLLEYNFNQPAPTPFRVAVVGEDGPKASVPVPESPTAISPYQLELAHFIDCIVNKALPIVTAKDGLEAVRIAEAALLSIRTNTPI